MNKLNGYAIKCLCRALRHPFTLLGRPLPPAFREKVILRVSAINDCYVCSLMHETWAGLHDVPKAEIACVRSKQVSDPRLRVALDYADARTLQNHDGERALQAELEHLFSPSERLALAVVIDLYTFTNRFNNTWEGWLPGHRRRRQRLGLAG